MFLLSVNLRQIRAMIGHSLNPQPPIQVISITRENMTEFLCGGFEWQTSKIDYAQHGEPTLFRDFKSFIYRYAIPQSAQL
jgi:hypothetical protein